MRKALIAIAATAVLGMAGCASENPQVSGPSSVAGGVTPTTSVSTSPCQNARVKTPGTLSIGTSYPYYRPFKFGSRNDPTGFEGELAKDIARKMGLSQVKWVIGTFESLYAPGPKSWDVAMDEISIKPERAKVVDFSDRYYTIQQGLLVRKGTPITGARTVADLKPYTFGAQSGTTGLDYIKNVIKPAKVQQYDDTNTAGQALSNGQIDAVVIDVPIALPMTQQFKNLQVIGQFLTNEGYGMTLEKGNPLLACVNFALAALRADGTLKALTDKYFPNEKDAARLPVFK